MPNEVRVSVAEVQVGVRYRLHVEPGLIVEGSVLHIDDKENLWLKLDPQWNPPAGLGKCLVIRRRGVRRAEKLW